MTKKTLSTELPKKLAHGLAYLQDGVDRLIGFSMTKLKSAAEQKPARKTSKATKTLKGIAAFLGTLGTEYYEKYETLKSQRQQKSAKRKS